MARRLRADEQALWRRVVASVRPLQNVPAEEPLTVDVTPPEPPQPLRQSPAAPAPRPARRRPQPGETLDSTWDRRLARGLVQPDVTVDLHGHNLATAHAMLDTRLEQAIASGARLMLLVTGKPPQGERWPIARGAIRAAVGDWLGASHHAGEIAAIRNAHPRHGGQGALYIVLRRNRRSTTEY